MLVVAVEEAMISRDLLLAEPWAAVVPKVQEEDQGRAQETICR